MTNAAWWYVNRAAGLVAWVLLTGSLLVGLLLSGKALGRKARPNWLLDLHRGLSGLAVAFVGVHIVGAVADSYVHFGVADILVPGASGWRPLAIAWGVVSLYLLVAVEASSLLRKHIPKQIWKRLHFLSFPLFLTATAHGITAGTEMGKTAGLAAAAVATVAIAGLTTHRVAAETRGRNRPSRPPGPPRPTAPIPPVAYVGPTAPAQPVRSPEPVGRVPVHGPF